MNTENNYDVIIIGGSYAGLSAAMSLGRALKQVLIIDSGKPCNRQTPHSHNFITQDGKTPREIAEAAQEQVLKYDTVKFHEGLAHDAAKTENGFVIKTEAGETFTAKKLIFATGLYDIMPEIEGFAECWGISILHCPYCHGYEVRNKATALIGNGDIGFEFVRLIFNWTKDLTLFTNGASTLSAEQTQKLAQHNIGIVETEIESFEHQNGMVKNIVLKDKSKVAVEAIYARPKGVQHSNLPEVLGCELTEQGLIKIENFQKTTVAGVYACGDNSFPGRTVSTSVAAGTMAGIMVNRELLEEEF